MTYERREQILSKEVMSTSEFGELMDLDYCTASAQMNAIKKFLRSRDLPVRLDVRGKIHVQDYLDVYRLSGDRYFSKKKENTQMVLTGTIDEILAKVLAIKEQNGDVPIKDLRG